MRFLMLAAILSASSVLPAQETIEITKDTVLDPSKTYGAIVIKGSNLTIDGRGATLRGSGAANPKGFTGTAISADGVSNVTLKNIKAKGWNTGLHVKNAKGWTIESCDFSDNFHDPEFGWGEQGRRGGIVLENVKESILRKNVANRVWDACVLVDSNDNTLADNDFSHTSNTCLKLWNASRNTVKGNNLSYGLRIKTGEVHARDSTCVLIESGSNENYFAKNDCTHGGDGIFIRVLNGWVSAGNVFDENDASYANNNGFEAWAPRNVYISNKANYCSYGFWLGASDGTILVGNEASHNGEPSGFHNSPHLPKNGHAGIVFMFGPSSHTVARANRCQNNNGAGIALIGDEASKGKAWRAFHWILEDNTLADNRWGVYARYADWLDLAGNTFANNADADFSRDETVTNVFLHDAPAPMTTRAILEGPSVAKVGEAVAFDASKSLGAPGLAFRWDLGDGTIANESKLVHTFTKPGFYRVGMTAFSGDSSDLAYRDLYVVDDLPEIGTEDDISRWSWIDPRSKVAFSSDTSVHLAGSSSVKAVVNPYGGGRVGLAVKHEVSLRDKRELVFWIKAVITNIPAWQGPNPVVTLTGLDGKTATLTPKTDLLAQPSYNEAREGWTRVVVPLEPNDGWSREGEMLATAKTITLGFDSWGGDPLTLWVDGLMLR